jgi:hypothetical protein
VQRTLQQVTKQQVARRGNKQAQKEPQGTRRPYRTPELKQSHRRISQKNRVLRKVRQGQLQTAMKIPLVPKKPVVKVPMKAVKRFVKNEVPKKRVLKTRKG